MEKEEVKSTECNFHKLNIVTLYSTLLKLHALYNLVESPWRQLGDKPAVLLPCRCSGELGAPLHGGTFTEANAAVCPVVTCQLWGLSRIILLSARRTWNMKSVLKF